LLQIEIELGGIPKTTFESLGRKERTFKEITVARRKFNEFQGFKKKTFNQSNMI
jgi:hypothetical protein